MPVRLHQPHLLILEPRDQGVVLLFEPVVKCLQAIVVPDVGQEAAVLPGQPLDQAVGLLQTATLALDCLLKPSQFPALAAAAPGQSVLEQPVLGDE